MRGAPGIAAKFTAALAKAKINIKAIAQGSSERNISILITNADTKRAVRAAYQAFFNRKEEK
jgi:aspartokinase/homoserine dehydrogenase 1